MKKFFGMWDKYAEMVDSFSDYHEPKIPLSMATEDEILFASYGSACYDGDAVVLFIRDGKLFEVAGSHCSCFGLEGQWEPDEITWEQLELRPAKEFDLKGDNWREYNFLRDHDDEARLAFRELVKTRGGVTTNA